MPNRQGTVGSAILWMFVLSVLLFWAPIVGPLIAGFVGGRKAGTQGNAILAAILPGLIFGAALFLLASLVTGVPLLGFVRELEVLHLPWPTSVHYSWGPLWAVCSNSMPSI